MDLRKEEKSAAICRSIIYSVLHKGAGARGISWTKGSTLKELDKYPEEPFQIFSYIFVSLRGVCGS